MPNLYFLISIIWLLPSNHFAQVSPPIPIIYSEIEVAVSPEKAWNKVAIEFVNIGDFHSGMDFSYAIDKTLRFGKNASRHCQISENGFVREHITLWDAENKRFEYEAFAAEGIEMPHWRNEIGIKVKNGKTYIYHTKAPTTHISNSKRKKLQKVNLFLLQSYRNNLENKDYSKPSQKELKRKYTASKIPNSRKISFGEAMYWSFVLDIF